MYHVSCYCLQRQHPVGDGCVSIISWTPGCTPTKVGPGPRISCYLFITWPLLLSIYSSFLLRVFRRWMMICDDMWWYIDILYWYLDRGQLGTWIQRLVPRLMPELCKTYHADSRRILFELHVSNVERKVLWNMNESTMRAYFSIFAAVAYMEDIMLISIYLRYFEIYPGNDQHDSE